MRYCFALLALGVLVGCTNTDVNDLSDTNSNPHNVNKPVTTDNPTGVPNADPGRHSTPTVDPAPMADPAITPAPAPPADPAPAVNEPTRNDNTAVNERDNKDSAKTPLDQSNKNTDITLTANIRQKIVNHEGMSINGRNVKIITDGGRVTLRGPVNSQEEKDLIAQFAKDVAGENNVDNQLEIASDTKPAEPTPPAPEKAANPDE